LLEQLPDPRGAEADEHLHELRSRHEEERHLGLAGHGPGQEGLPAPRRAEEEHALGDPPSQPLVLLGVFQERHDLLELFDGLVDAGHVLERGLEVLAVVDLHAALAEVEGPSRPAAGHPPEHEPPDGHQNQDGEDPGEQEVGECAGLPARELDVVLPEEIQQLLLVDPGWADGGEAGPALVAPELPGHLGLGDGHPLHLALLHLPEELRVVQIPGLGHEQRLEEEQHQDAEQDVAQGELPPASIASPAAELETLPPARGPSVVAPVRQYRSRV
jgi:hypothetical protein